MGWYDRSGGVGVRVRRLTDRCRDFRDNIEPAHDFTFFCFFLELGFLDIDDLRDEGCSVESMGTSGLASGLVAGAAAAAGVGFLVSFDEAELDGRDRLGDDSPDVVSWPKKPHFLAGNLGLVGVATASLSSGLELLRRGFGRFSGVGEVSRVPSNLGPALLGLSIPLSLDARCSLESGEEVPPDTMDVRLPETECPRIVTVEELSLDTRDNGRGIISTLSENPTRARFN